MAQNEKKRSNNGLIKEEKETVEEEIELRRLVKRVASKDDFIQHNRSLCVGCGKCVKICPMDLWVLRKGKARISKDYSEKCLECGSCWLVCKQDAIDFSYPKGGTGVTWEFG